MKNKDRRREYLFSQALTYLIAGLFLLSYVKDVQDSYLFWGLGGFLCIVSFINIIVAIFLYRYLHKMENLDYDLQQILLIITFIAFFLGLFQTSQKPYFELRIIIAFVWLLFALGSLLLRFFFSAFNALRNYRISNSKEFLHNFFSNLAYATLLFGLFLIIEGIFHSKTTDLLTSMNKWAYNPFLYLFIATLCVLPILILAPNDDAEGD